MKQASTDATWGENVQGFTLRHLGAGCYVLIDKAEFNNRGEKHFTNRGEAIDYAEWAELFKTGRTFTDFEDWRPRFSTFQSSFRDPV